jgi:hypothetical protein
MAAFAVASTLQDHVRRVLHMAGAHWRAAMVSLVQLVAIACSLAVLELTRVRPVWRPFAALTVPTWCRCQLVRALEARSQEHDHT